jgi:hypothetical protein
MRYLYTACLVIVLLSSTHIVRADAPIPGDVRTTLAPGETIPANSAAYYQIPTGSNYNGTPITAPTGLNTVSGLTCTNGTCTYTPLEPLPTGLANKDAQNGNNFPAFLSGMFRLLISFGGLFAVVMLVIAGIGYMVSESAPDISKAKDRAKNALWGILLLTGSYIILNTINPQLINFKLLVQPTQATITAPTGASATTPTPTNTTVGACESSGGTARITPDGWTCPR